MDSTRPRETINATESHSSSFELKVSSDQSIKDQLQLFPGAQVFALLIIWPSKLAGHWKLVWKHSAGIPWGLIHELHKSYIYLARPTKFTPSTVGHLLLLLPLVITSSTGSWPGPRCSEHTTHCFPASHEWWMEVTELFIQTYCTPLDCDIRWQGFCHCSFSNVMEWAHFQPSPGSPESILGTGTHR